MGRKKGDRSKHGRKTSRSISPMNKLPGWEENILDAAAADNCKHLAELLGSVSHLPHRGTMTALHVAASAGSLNVVNWILDQPQLNIEMELAKVDAENGWTPLHRAVYFGQLAVATRLLSAGAALHSTDFEGCSVIDLATIHLNGLEQSHGSNAPSTPQSPDRPNRRIQQAARIFAGLNPEDGGYDDADGGDSLENSSSSRSPEVYSWGSARNYTLGHPDGDHKNWPTRIPAFVEDNDFARFCDTTSIKSISTSSYHSMFLTHEGEVLVCGFGQGHRLGNGDESTRIEPTPVERLRAVRVRSIAAGRDHSAVVTEDGEAYIWGSNGEGQLGTETPSLPFPTRVRLPRREKIQLRGVAVSKWHTFVWGRINNKTRSENVWVWGNDVGQMGLPKSASQGLPKWQPRQVSFFNSDTRKIASVCASPQLTVCMAKSHEIFILRDFCTKRLQPYASMPRSVAGYSSIKKSKVIKVVCSGPVLCYLTNLGKVFVFMDETSIPLNLAIGRRSLGVADIAVGSAEATNMIALVIIAEDKMVYRAAVRLSKSDSIVVTPTRVPGIHQACKVWCGPHAEHMLCLRQPRSIDFRIDLDWRMSEEDLLDRISFNPGRLEHASIPDKILLLGGDCSITMSCSRNVLEISPVLATSCLHPWSTSDCMGENRQTSITVNLPVVLGSSVHQIPLEMLAQYLEEKSIDETHVDVAHLLGLLFLADALLIDELKLIVEQRIATALTSAIIMPVFTAAIYVKGFLLPSICAKHVVNNLETMMESNQLQYLPQEALLYVSNCYKQTFAAPRAFVASHKLRVMTKPARKSKGRKRLSSVSSLCSCSDSDSASVSSVETSAGGSPSQSPTSHASPSSGRRDWSSPVSHGGVSSTWSSPSKSSTQPVNVSPALNRSIGLEFPSLQVGRSPNRTDSTSSISTNTSIVSNIPISHNGSVTRDLDYLDDIQPGAGPLNWLGCSPPVSASWIPPSSGKKSSQKERRRVEKQRQQAALQANATPTLDVYKRKAKVTTGWNQQANPTKSKPTSFLNLIAEEDKKTKKESEEVSKKSARKTLGFGSLEWRKTEPSLPGAALVRLSPPPTPTTSGSSDFMSILKEQEQTSRVDKAVVSRNRGKSLKTIQVEEAALREISALYKTDEELVTVRLVSRASEMALNLS